MDGSGLLLMAVIGMLAAAALGWWLGSRGARSLQTERDLARAERDAGREEAANWQRKFSEIAVNLAAEAEKVTRIPELERQLGAEREAASLHRSEADRLRPVAERVEQQDRDLAALRTEKERLAAAQAASLRGEAERQQAYEKQLAHLDVRFGELASKAVDGAHDRFLKQAEERFGHAGKQNEDKLKALLDPVHTTLERYEQGLKAVEKERVGSYRELREAVELVRSGQSQVRDETIRLVNALRHSPKSRGRWGEQSLKNVLEQAGLSPFADFQSEVSVDTGDGRLRPDVVVRLPGGRKLIIDAKCSLNAFLDANDEVEEGLRTTHLKAHLASIRRHAEQLGSKAYWQQFGDSADYVVMYIPGEHFLTAALEQDHGLWEWAFERRVLLATPTNLVAIARTVASVWRQEKVAEEAAEIARLGRELHSRLATMTSHVAKLGRNLELANGAYNQMVGSFESQVFTQARRFETLGASSAKELLVPPMVEASPRPLTRLAPVAASGEGTELSAHQ